MNQGKHWAVIAGVASCLAFTSYAEPPAQGFFRLQGLTNTTITDFSSTGWLTWSNVAVGGSCLVEWLASMGVSNDWKPFVHYPVTTAVCQVRVFIPAPPTGMVFVAAGQYQQGNCMDPDEGYLDELPIHEVYVSPFYMDQFEVTKSVWDTVHGWATNHAYSFENSGSGKSASHPVESINWYDATKWCNARSEMESLTPVYRYYEFILDEFGDPIGTNIVVYRTGTQSIPPELADWTANGYRLPTEAEWELAARSGTGGHRFPWTETDTITQTNANYYSFGDGGATYPYDANLTEGYPFDTGPGTEPFTGPVGSFAPNAYGLHDIAGNVSEWCWDWYDADFYAATNSTEVDTKGPTAQVGDFGRVVRGGAWGSGAYEARCSRRDNVSPGGSSSSLGFRCVRRR